MDLYKLNSDRRQSERSGCEIPAVQDLEQRRHVTTVADGVVNRLEIFARRLRAVAGEQLRAELRSHELVQRKGSAIRNSVGDDEDSVVEALAGRCDFRVELRFEFLFEGGDFVEDREAVVAIRLRVF